MHRRGTCYFYCRFPRALILLFPSPLLRVDCCCSSRFSFGFLPSLRIEPCIAHPSSTLTTGSRRRFPAFSFPTWPSFLPSHYHVRLFQQPPLLHHLLHAPRVPNRFRSKLCLTCSETATELRRPAALTWRLLAKKIKLTTPLSIAAAAADLESFAQVVDYTLGRRRTERFTEISTPDSRSFLHRPLPSYHTRHTHFILRTSSSPSTTTTKSAVPQQHNTVGDERQLALFFTAVQLVDAVKRLPLVV